MASEDRAREALQLWIEYGRTSAAAFHLPLGCVSYEDLAGRLKDAKDEDVREFIATLRELIALVRSLKFAAEPIVTGPGQ
jgi:hypothetical protein